MSDRRTLSVDEYLAIASAVLDLDAERLNYVCNRALSESALGAPLAGFGDLERYPEPAQKVAVLVERLARNHPLPDGNKRAAFIAGVLYARRLGFAWLTQDVERDAGMVEALAAGTATHDQAVAWVRERTRRF